MPADDVASIGFGAWTATELAETAQAVSPPGADTDSSDLDRFRAGVAKLIHLRHLLGHTETHPAVFLLARPTQTKHSDWNRTLMLDNGLTDVGGNVWLVN